MVHGTTSTSMSGTQVHVLQAVISCRGATAMDKRTVLRGGLTRQEFDSLREDIRQLFSDHPRAELTILLLDEEGHCTEDLESARRYGLVIYEDDILIHEELGDVVEGVLGRTDI